MAQAKLVIVLKGRVRDVVVDCRHGSPTFGRSVRVDLDGEDWQQLFVPEGFAHGFCTLEPDTVVLYKVSAPYAPKLDGGLLWNDPDLGSTGRLRRRGRWSLTRISNCRGCST
jgi:dTDP-4-dehydrorhamnose 3,5-epimerase